jgi:hypothetical protein
MPAPVLWRSTGRRHSGQVEVGIRIERSGGVRHEISETRLRERRGHHRLLESRGRRSIGATLKLDAAADANTGAHQNRHAGHITFADTDRLHA